MAFAAGEAVAVVEGEFAGAVEEEEGVGDEVHEGEFFGGAAVAEDGVVGVEVEGGDDHAEGEEEGGGACPPSEDEEDGAADFGADGEHEGDGSGEGGVVEELDAVEATADLIEILPFGEAVSEEHHEADPEAEGEGVPGGGETLGAAVADGIFHE